MSLESSDGQEGSVCNYQNPAKSSAARPDKAGEKSNGPVFKRHSPRSVEFEAVEPWLEPVDGKELLDCLVTELQRFVVFSKWITETLALWILHTYAFRLR